jgi:hypothetical protein
MAFEMLKPRYNVVRLGNGNKIHAAYVETGEALCNVLPETSTITKELPPAEAKEQVTCEHCKHALETWH